MNVVLYNSASRGSGQFVRALKIADIVCGMYSDASCRVLVGNAAVPLPLPPRTSLVELPVVSKAFDGSYVAHADGVAEAFSKRQAIIQRTIDETPPDLFLVDSRPLGLDGELRHVLHRVGGRTLRVLVLRDVLDDPELVQARWRQEGLQAAVRAYYDAVLLLGEANVYDPLSACRLEHVRSLARFAGYLGYSRAPHSTEETVPGRVVVTVGGGADGTAIVRTVAEYLQAMRNGPDRQFHLVLGHLSPVDEVALRAAFPALRQHEVLRHVVDLRGIISTASLVISMCGYNSCFELLELSRKVLFVPRCTPGREQLIRAEAIGRVCDATWTVRADDLTIDTLAEGVERALSASTPSRRVPIRGREGLAAFLRAALP